MRLCVWLCVGFDVRVVFSIGCWLFGRFVRGFGRVCCFGSFVSFVWLVVLLFLWLLVILFVVCAFVIVVVCPVAVLFNVVFLRLVVSFEQFCGCVLFRFVSLLVCSLVCLLGCSLARSLVYLLIRSFAPFFDCLFGCVLVCLCGWSLLRVL